MSKIPYFRQKHQSERTNWLKIPTEENSKPWKPGEKKLNCNNKPKTKTTQECRGTDSTNNQQTETRT